MADKMKYFCKKCKKTMDGTEFYTSNNLEKYPNNGKFDECKKCMTMHVDNWNPESYLWILQEADVPYIPGQWDQLMETYAKDKTKVTGLTIVGRYLAKMRLSQYKKWRWKDTEFLAELERKKREEAMTAQGYNNQEIELANAEAAQRIPDTNTTFAAPVVEVPAEEEEEAYVATGDEDYFAQEQDDDIELTDENRIYLRLKWGKTYRPEEWVRLEQLYNDMKESYDIQGAGHEDNLKLLCKTSLKANQLIDMGDVEGFQKMSKVYDQLMKSGKFTAAQNKDIDGNAFDSIGELVALCEREGFIPRYYIGSPNDKVDQTIVDMQRYTKTLITEETNLGPLIEEAIKANKREDEASEDTDSELLDDIAELEQQLHDNDFQEFGDFMEEEALSDDAAIAGVSA